MRAKLVTIVLSLFAAAALGFSATSVSAGENAGLSNAGAEVSPAQAARRNRRRAATMKGVPKGVDKCFEHLMEMASEDPMTPYEGHPEEIINNGLLWNDPKSNCYIGDDHSLKLKLHDLSKAWRMKETAKVRSLLDEIKDAAPK